MDAPAGRTRRFAFLLRVQPIDGGVRGEVVVVTTGVVKLFDNLVDAMTFIEAQIRARQDAPPEPPRP